MPVSPAPDHVLSTARLVLRPPVLADVDDVYALTGDPRTVAHNPSDLLADRAEALELVRRWIGHWARYGFGYWCVHDDAMAFVGVCGIKVVSLHSVEVLNLLYRFAPEAWGHGYATEAATAVLSWARVNVPDRRVVARVRPANIASARVALKAGMIRTPSLDDDGEDGRDLVFATE